jgi:hypothetical protein
MIMFVKSFFFALLFMLLPIGNAKAADYGRWLCTSGCFSSASGVSVP